MFGVYMPKKTLILNGKRVFEDMMITHRISIDYFCSFFLYAVSPSLIAIVCRSTHTVYRQKVLVTFKKSLFLMQKSYRLIENFNFKCLLCEFSFVCVLYAEKMLMFYLYDYRYYRSSVRHV